MQIININNIIDIVIQLFFISISFWCIKDIHLEKYVRMHENQFKILLTLLSIMLGFSCGSFFIWIINIFYSFS
ncbi:DUF1146 domain-containing protein [Apilactobacillus timberlakei]|uniref:DUF1146 domain-containing protein n=1 Tax=Apilactobacillus timberlakei TaxID=2008380 RepID=A0ABY2YWE1_9LACO|nr:DUF1146 domain-containing protein [Apilactobacillus timberlakei]TPR13475.1 DUF1146 domain-containing protein [Apilactobacillus timberlakei]TPR15548.1 DUF1146 domain-containing protein [Apilactobacillus timberlakei]TPR17796.1 DUF1146 domain-containing protein [Apilactobacillus timberlakei]TPR22746.1 DUF1146 domain-containing protein [Apilactobacillus timberlakei]